MSYRVYGSGNMLVLMNTDSWRTERIPRDKVWYEYTATDSPILYSLYYDSPERDLVIDKQYTYFQKEDTTGFADDAEFQDYLDTLIGHGCGDWQSDIAKGKIAGHSYIHKFGLNENVNGTFVPVAFSGVYQVPTTPQSLEFVSSSVNDALNSTGAHEIKISGLDANWDLQTVYISTHATNGTIPVQVTGLWLRVFDMCVSKSGAYANISQPSHAGTITLRATGAGVTYAVIGLYNGFALGGSYIGAYTVPNGYTAYLMTINYSSDISGTKTTNFNLFKRENADDVTGTTYNGVMIAQQIYEGTQGALVFNHESREIYPAKTDVGIIVNATATTKASASFELLLIKNGY